MAAIGEAGQTKKESQVAREFSIATKAHEDLHKVIGVLDGKLKPVLCPKPELASGDSAKDSEQLCSVASEIKNIRLSIERATALLHNFVKDIEL